MRYGVVFPQIEFGNDVQAIRDYAQTAGGLSFEHPFHEPMVFFGFLAAATTGSGSSAGSSSCRTGRPRWSPSRPPRWTC